MKIFDRRIIIVFIITIALLTGIFLFNNKSSYAMPSGVPEIVSFEPSTLEDNALKVIFKSSNTGSNFSYELMNATTIRQNNLSGSVNEYTIQGLENGKTYKIAIRACTNDDKYECTDFSAPKSATAKTKSKAINNTVNTPSITKLTSKYHSIKLSYKTSGTISGVEIYNTVSKKKYKTTNKSTFTETGLKSNTKYKYKIRGYYKYNNKTYYSSYSALKSIKTKKAKSNYYTTIYNANGGTGSMPKQKIKIGVRTKLYPNKFKRKGYVFIGWGTASSKNKVDSKTHQKGIVLYKNKQVVKNLAKKGNVKLYAIWRNKKVFSNERVLILGDSIVAGCGKYPEVAAKQLGGITTNKARGGRTLSYVPSKAAKKNSIYYTIKNESFYSSNNLKKYPFVIIAAGTNDYAWGSINTTTVRNHTSEIVKTLRKANPDSTIIFVTPIRRWSGSVEKKSLEKYRKAIKAGAAGYKNILIINGTDITKSSEYKHFRKESANRRLHPNSSYAKKVLAPRLAYEIKKQLTR